MAAEEETPKIHIDSDWKDQAQAEKERLRALEEEASAKAASAAGGGPAAGGAGGGIPAPSFDSLLGTLATQAMMYLGGMADPQTGKAMVDLEAGRHFVDLLSVLEEKTKGNLSEEETKNLSTILYELRMRYVQIAQAAGAQMGMGGDEEGQPGAGGIGGGPSIQGP